jgi:8-oxo-dGTP diphosphatase
VSGAAELCWLDNFHPAIIALSLIPSIRWRFYCPSIILALLIAFAGELIMTATVSQHRGFSCAILTDPCGRYLFQKRDDIPSVVHAGKTGFFGGQRESGETPLQCIVREVYEEIGYLLPPERFEYFLSHDVSGNLGEFFIARNVPSDNLVVTEGQLRMIEEDEIEGIWDDFTSTAQFVLKAFRKVRN